MIHDINHHPDPFSASHSGRADHDNPKQLWRSTWKDCQPHCNKQTILEGEHGDHGITKASPRSYDIYDFIE